MGCVYAECWRLGLPASTYCLLSGYQTVNVNFRAVPTELEGWGGHRHWTTVGRAAGLQSEMEMLVQTCPWVKGFPEEVMPEADAGVNRS